MKQKVILLSLMLFVSVGLLGQYADTLQSPLLMSVSVDPFYDFGKAPSSMGGRVTLRWKPWPIAGINGYFICEYLKTSGVWGGKNAQCLPDPNRTDTTFRYDSVIYKPTYFIIYAITGLTPCDPNKIIPYRNIHRTIYTSLDYDSCKSQIAINWTKYLGWGDSLAYYRVYQTAGTSSVIVADNLSPNDTSYVVSSVQGNQKYCYYLEALHKNGMSVTSNMACRQTHEKNLPAYINADQAVFSPNSVNPVELQFTLDPASETKDYQLSVSDSHDGDFTPAKKLLNVQGNSLTIVDTLQRLAPKYYRLDALNSCGKAAKSSNQATAIVPIASVGTNEIMLAWNAYLDWPNGVSNYELYRGIGDGGFQLLQTLSGSTTDYTDDVSNLIGRQLSGNLCYYIESLPNLSGVQGTYRSRSATVCLDITANVFLPNAFTPNDDGQNDEFKPSFAFLPSAYFFTVFDRSGFKIFETTDPMKGWNGRFPNNQKAPEGVYAYIIRFTSGSGKIVEKKGDFSLVYP